MSIGFLVGENDAMIWRGPMVMGAMNDLLFKVEWGPLDFLILDMPPGRILNNRLSLLLFHIIYFFFGF